MTFIEKLATGGTVAAIGILTVFGVLLILIGCITLVSKLVVALEEKANAKAKAPVANVANTAVQATEDVSDAKLVAVITAAVMCVLASEGGDKVQAPFVIKKIKEIRR